MKVVGSNFNMFLIGFDLPQETQCNSCLICYSIHSCVEVLETVWRMIINKAVRSLSPQGHSFVHTITMLILYFQQLFSISVDKILSSYEVQTTRNCSQVLWCHLSLSLHPQWIQLPIKARVTLKIDSHVPQVISAQWPNAPPREFCESCLTPLKSSPAQTRAAALTELRLECLCCKSQEKNQGYSHQWFEGSAQVP